MTLRHVVLFLVVTSCTPSNGSRGDAGAQGSPGEQGLKGSTGATGAPGASGVCDLSSCPQITSVDGLAGGSLSGTTTVGALNVSGNVVLDSNSVPEPRGIVIGRGGKQTSIGGFYCGKTSFTVSGVLGDPTQTVPPSSVFGPLRMAKQHCELACDNKPAAHPCQTTEVLQWIMLGGGSSTFTTNAPNPDVLMPPSPGVYWVLPADGNAECSGPTGPSNTGVVYSITANEGHLAKEACSQDHALLCCL